MKRRVYMYASGDCVARLRIDPFLVSDVIDMFGKSVKFGGETADTVEVSLTANAMAIEQFAKNFAPDVLVLEPPSLREKVRNDLERGAAAYRL